MAATFAVTDLVRSVHGNQRQNTGKVTVTGTPTANGDAITPAAVGLTRVENLVFDVGLDSTSAPAAAVVPRWEKSTGKVSFWGDAAVAGAGSPLEEVTSSLTGYTFRFVATGY